MSNNISIRNISLTGQDTSAGPNNDMNFTFVKFDLNWANSWRTSIGPSNWDAAWVFVKYRVFGEEWKHAYINEAGHLAPLGTTIDVGLLTPGALYNNNSNPGLGVFVYRSNDGSGTFSPSNIHLRWNYGINNVPDNALLEVKVFAVEMVYVVEGSFYLGDGLSECAFYTSPDVNIPYHITADSVEINVSTTPGDLYYDNNCSSDQLGPIPAAFPKGFNAFYCMKYEITQQQYVDFLNTLNTTQQTTRTQYPINSPPFSGALDVDNFDHSGIVIMTSSFDTIPAVYSCNLYPGALMNQINDGHTYPCNFLSWSDITALLDWSGLRPITELEYEKACRGTSNPVVGEFAWGNTLLVHPTSKNDIFTFYETSNPNNSNCFIFWGNLGRVGQFAKSSTNREQSGASFYGIMEMSGSLSESFVSVGNVKGRSFTGLHGNGHLNPTGNSDVSNWFGPYSFTSNGFGSRGGSFCSNINASRISDRQSAFVGLYGRSQFSGGRGGRIAP